MRKLQETPTRSHLTFITKSPSVNRRAEAAFLRSGCTIPLANSPLLWGHPEGASGARSQDGKTHKGVELKGEEALQALCFWLNQRPRLPVPVRP